MTNIAIIPARGGSKRLPRKNIIPVMGNPALFYPVQAALKAKLFDHIIVSTEDDEIALKALQSGAKVMKRAKKLAGDKANIVQVCTDVLEKLHDEGIKPDKFCCIYATAVFITHKDLQQSFAVMKTFSDTKVVLGVSDFNLQPVQALEDRGDGILAPKWKDLNRLQSQQQPKLCASNGTLCWADTGCFLKNATFYVKQLRGYTIPWIRAIDLDTLEDYKNVELLAPLFLNVDMVQNRLSLKLERIKPSF